MVRCYFNGLLQPGKTSQRMTEQISNVNPTQATEKSVTTLLKPVLPSSWLIILENPNRAKVHTQGHATNQDLGKTNLGTVPAKDEPTLHAKALCLQGQWRILPQLQSSAFEKKIPTSFAHSFQKHARNSSHPNHAGKTLLPIIMEVENGEYFQYAFHFGNMPFISGKFSTSMIMGGRYPSSFP